MKANKTKCINFIGRNEYGENREENRKAAAARRSKRKKKKKKG